MAISVADNFSYQGGKPLDARMKYNDVTSMVAVPAANLYDGCFAYVTAEQKYYSYDSANDTDPTLGKWREYSGGGGGDVDPMPAEDMDDILTPLPGVMARSIYNSRFNRSDMYSTDEVLIGKWIDGKPLYQKVFDGTLPSNVDAFHELIEIQNAYIVGGIVYAFQGNDQYPNIQSIDFSQAYCYFQNSKVLIRLKTSAIENKHYYGIIQYTKTTDGTTKVDFDADYSTDETIVGRWIDGKPLYQKTVDCGALPNNTTKTVAHGISNVDIIYVTSGIAYSNNKNSIVTIPNAHPLGVDKTIHTSANRTDIVIATGTDRSELSNSYVTIQYTKTTD